MPAIALAAACLPLAAALALGPRARPSAKPRLWPTPKSFFLHNGDRVCFYGDSITEQRFYPAEVETYVLTRFPQLHVRFIDAAVGGDRVTGGWAGPIDLRLERDVFPFKPTVVTIMLGMNDAGYQPFNAKLFDTFKKGYRHIIASLRQHLPGVRIVLLETSPFDDVTQAPQFPGGYNGVLDRYDTFVRQLGREDHLLVVDFNTPMVRVTREMWKTDPKLAKQVIPGRVHPSAAGEMMMAQALLKAWHAPATVTQVSLQASRRLSAIREIKARNTTLLHLHRAAGELGWDQYDSALPAPMLALHEKWPQFPKWDLFIPPQPNPDYTNPVTAMIDKLNGFTRQLDQERLQVSGLADSEYALSIDGQKVANFSASQLQQGVNLARDFTPMLRQAYRVENLVWEEIEAHFVAWHSVQTPLQGFPEPTWTSQGPSSPGQLPLLTSNDPAAPRAVAQTVAAMGRLQTAIAARERQDSQPKMHHYELRRISQP